MLHCDAGDLALIENATTGNLDDFLGISGNYRVK
jgi:hypothetical protein